MSLDWVQRALREGLGFSPYPATLNLRLEAEKEIAAWREIKNRAKGIAIDPPDPSSCRARCFRVDIEGRQEGAILLPEVAGYPANKIEVIAPVRLKEALKIEDGDEITLEILD